MPYEITATRKRPQSFEELAGQDFVSATLRASIRSGRIAHAYLFSGPRGCGKTSTARILARSLNCENGPSAEPCGTCDSCRSIARGAAMDVIEIDGASNTSVENVRQIKDEVLFPPNSSKYKIYIIDEVHMLSNSAFNALLKTIEEPPPYIVFIFATTELHKVPATIKSRCQQFNFRLISLDVIRDRLRSAAEDLGVKADDDAMLWIAREATGSLRDAYTLFDQVAAFSDGHISSAKIRDKLGLVGSERMGSLMELCVSGDRGGALALLDSILEGGVSVEQFAADAVSYARSLLLIACGIDRESLVGAPRSSFPESVVAALDPPRIERMLADLFDLYRDMRYSVNPRWELELAVARLSAIRDFVPPAEIARTVAGLKRALAGGAAAAARPAGVDAPGFKAAMAGTFSAPTGDGDPPSAEPAPRSAGRAPAARVAQTGTGEDDLLDDGPEPAREPVPRPAMSEGLDLVELKKAVSASLAKSRLVLSMCLDRSGPWSLEGDRVTVPCANGYDASTVLADAAIVAKKATEIAGRPLRIEPKAAEPAPRPTPAPARDDDDDDGDGDDGPADPVALVEKVFRGRRVTGMPSRGTAGGLAGSDRDPNGE